MVTGLVEDNTIFCSNSYNKPALIVVLALAIVGMMATGIYMAWTFSRKI